LGREKAEAALMPRETSDCSKSVRVAAVVDVSEMVDRGCCFSHGATVIAEVEEGLRAGIKGMKAIFVSLV
jgi:hypothetical protein